MTAYLSERWTEQSMRYKCKSQAFPHLFVNHVLTLFQIHVSRICLVLFLSKCIVPIGNVSFANEKGHHTSIIEYAYHQKVREELGVLIDESLKCLPAHSAKIPDTVSFPIACGYLSSGVRKYIITVWYENLVPDPGYAAFATLDPFGVVDEWTTPNKEVDTALSQILAAASVHWWWKPDNAGFTPFACAQGEMFIGVGVTRPAVRCILIQPGVFNENGSNRDRAHLFIRIESEGGPDWLERVSAAFHALRSGVRWPPRK